MRWARPGGRGKWAVSRLRTSGSSLTAVSSSSCAASRQARLLPSRAVQISASGLSRRLGARWLPRGRAGERCPFHRRLRACAGAHRWLCAGGRRWREPAARHAILRPDALPCFSEQWPTLTDDAADAFLAVLTDGKVTGTRSGPTSICLPSSPFGAAAQCLSASLTGGQSAAGDLASIILQRRSIMSQLDKVSTAKTYTVGGREVASTALMGAWTSSSPVPVP